MKSDQLKLLTFDSIAQVPKKEWEEFCQSNFLNSYRFLEMLEKSNVESSEYRYVMIYQDQELIATAVLSIFRINLDIFVNSDKLVKSVRRIRKNWLKIDTLICGTPVSLGQSGIVIRQGVESEQVYSTLALEMKRIAKERKVKYLAVKEFKDGESEGTDVLEQSGYFRAVSLPNMNLDIPWNCFSDYVQQLRQGYRRQLRSSLKKIGLDLDFQPISKDASTVLEVTKSPTVTPEEFHTMYLSVMSRADSKLETLNLDFFKGLFALEHEHVLHCYLTIKGEIHGAAILFRQGEDLTFALVGKKSERDEFDTYFNLMTAIVRYAIENGFKRLILGQTSYYPKSKLGGVPVEQHFYFRSSKPLLQGLLKASKKALFPETDVQKLNVFK